MLNSYSDFKKPKSKFQLARQAREDEVNKLIKEAKEKKLKERKEREEYERLNQEEIKAEAERKRLEEEQKKKDREEYVKNVKVLYSPEKMEAEVKEFVNTLSKYDKGKVKDVISSFYQKEVDTLIDQFKIVFEDFPPSDPMKQALLSLFQVVMGQNIQFGTASHPDLTSE